ncbi:Influenza virus NS1A-binding -like protein [Trichinella patagoniensis]|uniref:Influenza virus NS1A-binding-like protein n=1 Tax=Trichinella patagoniensis TaxID=990121 RepID=A0A0V0ZC07_9BILA|nr:Influenza virus NS1A-binding -like protein [Trichinella patagoniensis]KRY09843.1 Influenza virus NS1A-binding -like protein [Trichinella patagoniensis]
MMLLNAAGESLRSMSISSSALSRTNSTSSACSSLIEDEDSHFRNRNSDLIFYNDKHKDDLLRWLSILRQNGELCDVFIIVNNREIHAHCVVLASAGGVIGELITSHSKFKHRSFSSNSTYDSDNGSHSLNLTSADSFPMHNSCCASVYRNERGLFLDFPHADYDCMEALVGYIYRGSLRLPKEKVTALYDLSCLLHVDSLAKVCAKYLSENLCIQNCISTRRCANRINDHLLAAKVDDYIEKHFAQIMQESKEFSSLPHVQATIIHLEKQCLDWSRFNEKLFGDQLLSWFQCLVKELPSHMEFRTDIIANQTFVFYVDNDWTLRDCFEVDDSSSVGSCDLVQDYKHANGRFNSHKHASSTSSRKSSSVKHTSADSLISVSSDHEEIEWKIVTLYKTTEHNFTGLFVIHKHLVVVSIHLASHVNNSVANGEILVAERLEKMAAPRCAFGVVVVDNCIIVLGGYNRAECLKSTECYDVTNNEWTDYIGMTCERGRFNAAASGNEIYIVGGSDGSNDLDTVEMIVFGKELNNGNKWKRLANLPSARSNAAVAYLDTLYCLGGWSGGDAIRECLQYDSGNNCWRRAEAGCAVYNGKIYVIGGCDGWEKLNTVEVYDPASNKWTMIAPMTTPRRACGAAVMNGKLFVVGGCDGVGILDSVEFIDLDDENSVWNTGQSMRTPRANARLVDVNSHLIVIGGFDGNSFLSSIESYAEGDSEWKKYK